MLNTIRALNTFDYISTEPRRDTNTRSATDKTRQTTNTNKPQLMREWCVFAAPTTIYVGLMRLWDCGLFYLVFCAMRWWSRVLSGRSSDLMPKKSLTATAQATISIDVELRASRFPKTVKNQCTTRYGFWVLVSFEHTVSPLSVCVCVCVCVCVLSDFICVNICNFISVKFMDMLDRTEDLLDCFQAYTLIWLMWRRDVWWPKVLDLMQSNELYPIWNSAGID